MENRPPIAAFLAIPLLAAFTALVPPAAASAWFHDITDRAGLGFLHETGAAGELRMPEIMGPGCALFDFDGDGRLDVFVTNGAFDGELAADPPTDRLYRQRSDGMFEDVTAASGVGSAAYGMGACLGDWDGDGWLDLYVTNDGPDVLYRNRGDGTFEDATERMGIASDGWSCSAAFVDFDADGNLDLFVTRYVDFDGARTCTDAAGRPEYCGPRESPPLSDLLFRNDGNRFTDVSEASGIAGAKAAGLGVVCADLDGDGLVDIYVANDAYANHLWINQGDGTFLDDALLLGAAFNQQGMAEAGMGIVCADFDDDLDLDLFVTHLRNESNTLYTFEGPDLGYEDRTAGWGLGAVSMPTTGFGTIAFDVELDGDLDLFVANGSVNRGEPWPGGTLASPWNRYAEPNHLYLNEGGSFRVATEAAGELGSRVELTRGAAVGDIDRDGDLDLLIANGQGPLRLYRNDAPRAGSWLCVRPRTAEGAAVAIGAVVRVRAGERTRMRTAAASFSYLSGSEPCAHFGLGDATAVDEIVVTWPDGTVERFAGGEADREVAPIRGTGAIVP